MFIVGELSATVGADNSGFKSAMKEVRTSGQKVAKSISKDFEMVGRKLTKIGQSMSTKLTAPLLAFGGASVKLFDQQAQALAQVEAGVRSTGGAAGFSVKELKRMASELQGITRFGDEQILQGATAQLLTFTNITGEAFKRTQQAALDLATRLGGDLKSASLQLGKALNDPVSNLSALSRSGIQFSDEQTEVIKSLTQTNRLAEAQGIILDELQRQYGGSAAAAAKAGAGGIIQLKNSLGDLTEEIGKVITQSIGPLVERVKMGVKWFQELDDQTKANIVKFGGIAAAIGPIVTGLGLLATALSAVTAPMIGIGVVAAGAVKVIYDNWEDIRAYFSSGPGAQLWETLKNTVTEAMNTIKEVSGTALELIESFWNTFGNDIIKFSATTLETVSGLFSVFFNSVNTMLTVWAKVFTGDYKGALNEIHDHTDTTLSQVFTLFDTFMSQIDVLGGRKIWEVLGIVPSSEQMNKTRRLKMLAEELAELSRSEENSIIALDLLKAKSLSDEIDRLSKKLKNQDTQIEFDWLAPDMLNGPDLGDKMILSFTGSLTDIKIPKDVILDNTEELDSLIFGMGDKIQSEIETLKPMLNDFTKSMTSSIGSSITGITDTLSTAFAESITGIKGMKDAFRSLEQIAKQALAGIIKNLIKVAILKTAVGIFSGGTSTLAMGLASGLKGMIPGAATGGIVPQGYPNDNYLARLTSGEMVIPKKDFESLSFSGMGFNLPQPDIQIPSAAMSSMGMKKSDFKQAMIEALQTMDLKVDSEGIYVASVRGEGDWNR